MGQNLAKFTTKKAEKFRSCPFICSTIHNFCRKCVNFGYVLPRWMDYTSCIHQAGTSARTWIFIKDVLGSELRGTPKCISFHFIEHLRHPMYFFELYVIKSIKKVLLLHDSSLHPDLSPKMVWDGSDAPCTCAYQMLIHLVPSQGCLRVNVASMKKSAPGVMPGRDKRGCGQIKVAPTKDEKWIRSNCTKRGQRKAAFLSQE